MEFKNRNPRQRRPVFDDIPSARWLDDSVWDKTRRRPAVQVSGEPKYRPAKASANGIQPLYRKISHLYKPLSVSIKSYLSKLYKHCQGYYVGFRGAASKTDYIKENKLKTLVLIGCSLALLVVPFTTIMLRSGDQKEVAGAATAQVDGVETVTPTNEPQFETVKPAGREFKKEDIVFDPQRKFAKFTDDVNGVPVIVSQQPLPEIYKSNPADGVAKISKDFGATELITFDGQQMYYGQDEKGPMTMIFSKNGNLVFVATTKAVDKEALKVYCGNFE